MSNLTLAEQIAADMPLRDFDLHLTDAVVKKDILFPQNARFRQTLAKVSRDELEERCLLLQEENLVLKKRRNQQEDKIKMLGSKVIRLEKSYWRAEKASSAGCVVRAQDVRMKEKFEELQEKVLKLEKQNERLSQHLLSAKLQLQTQMRRPRTYGHIQPLVNSGLARRAKHLEEKLSRRPAQGRYGQSLLEEARSEICNLKNMIDSQRFQMEEMERSEEMLRDQLRNKEREYEESLLRLKEQQASDQRLTIKGNVEVIRLQKQLAEKENAFTVQEGRVLQLQENQKTLKTNNEELVSKVDELTRQLKEERLKSMSLETQLHNKTLEEGTARENQKTLKTNSEKMTAKVDELTGQLKEERLKSMSLETQLHNKTLEEGRTREFLGRIHELEKERDMLKADCFKLVRRLTNRENMEMIQLQKQLAEKETAFTVLQKKFLQLQENCKTSDEELISKVEELTGQLKEERLKSMSLETQLHNKTLEEGRTRELQNRINDLEMSRDLFQQNCHSLMKSQEQKWRIREQHFKLQIAQLEMSLKSGLTYKNLFLDKNQILDKNEERDFNGKLMEENKILRHMKQKKQLDEKKIKAPKQVSRIRSLKKVFATQISLLNDTNHEKQLVQTAPLSSDQQPQTSTVLLR